MTYPKFKNKHLGKSLVYPNHEKIKLPDKFPKKFIIFYSETLLKYIKKEFRPKKVLDRENFEVFIYKDIGFIKIKGIGSPVAVVAIEELIDYGGKIFLNIGYAGGLKNEGIFLCEKALKDEGTSYHYLPHGHFTYPDKHLTDRLKQSLKKHDLDYNIGTTWTIDAPYRETSSEINHYKKQGITTVEMEASALFAVAKVRKVKIASAFVVSDVLGEIWEPKFHHINVKESLYKLFCSAVDCLSKG